MIQVQHINYCDAIDYDNSFVVQFATINKLLFMFGYNVKKHDGLFKLCDEKTYTEKCKFHYDAFHMSFDDGFLVIQTDFTYFRIVAFYNVQENVGCIYTILEE